MSKVGSWLRWAWRQEPLGVCALAVLVLIAVSAWVGPYFTQSPDAIHPLHQLQGPSLEHWFGTDNYGRDIFARVVYAGRVSLGLGFAVTVASSLIGAGVGLVAGYFRQLDEPIMRLMDGMMAFPPLILAIALVAAMGPGLRGEFIALSVVFTPRMARVVRGSTLQVKSRTFVDAARVTGVRVPSILARHILPNSVAPLIVQASFNFAETILADAALSFLGLGVAPPTPTWGNMIAAAKTYLGVDPWFALFPGLAIVVSVMALNIAGDSLRQIFGLESARGRGKREGRIVGLGRGKVVATRASDQIEDARTHVPAVEGA